MLSPHSQDFRFELPAESELCRNVDLRISGSPSSAKNSDISDLISIMTQFVRSQQKRLPRDDQVLEPRDRGVTVELPQNVKDLQRGGLEKFITELCKKVWSIAFNYFSKGELTTENTKIYASEQILKNLVHLCSKFSLGKQQFRVINRYLQTDVLNYMWHKYPMTVSKEVNRTVNRVVKQVDYTILPQHNYLNNVNFGLKYRDNGEYNDFIMKAINEVLKKTNTRVQNTSVYERFEQRISDLFELVMDSQFMEEKEKEDMNRQRSSQNVDEWENFSLQMTLNTNINRKDTYERAKESFSLANKAKYRQKVQAYTHSKIGKKLPDSTSHFTDEEIAAHNLTIENPQVNRFISKWCEQLQKKFEKFSYLDNVMEDVQKKNKGASGIKQMRECLKSFLVEEKQKIDNEMDELVDNNYMLQSDLMARQLCMSGCNSIEKYELTAAKYSLDIVNNLHAYTIKYLNRLIHGLLTATFKFKQQYHNLDISFSLITLQIMDLFRCKFTSGEKEVIRVYNEVLRQCQSKQRNVELVRVVNRLHKGTNDILINIKYRNILCEIQLAVNSNKSNFIQFSNAFNHYFYQIKRSLFGPITELCSIWKCWDTRFSLYQSIKCQIENPDRIIHKSDCLDHEQFEAYFKPFICNKCYCHYYDNVYIKNHLKCKKCDYWICAKCQINQSDCLNILNAAFKKEVVSKCKKIQKSQEIPEYGICLLIHCYETKIQPFRKVVNKTSCRIMGVKSKKIYQICDISTSQSCSKFKQNYLIFRIDKQYGKKHIKIDDQQMKQFSTQEKLRKAYLTHSEKICINQQNIDSKQLATLFDFGSSKQRQKINQIQLVGNNLESVDSILKLFPNVITLNLADNKLKEFKTMKQLNKLEKLSIDSNSIDVLPSELMYLKQIKELSASKNNIRVLPKGIGDLKDLRSLCLSRNKIQQLPSQIGKLQLSNLNISDNEIKYLRDEIFEMKDLQVLEVQTNRLSSINPLIKNMSKLKNLNLSHNQILNFPIQLAELHQLLKLNLSHNKLQEVPPDINQLTRLQQFYLSNNELNNKKGRKFPDINLFWDLIVLDLSHNYLEFCPRFASIVNPLNLHHHGRQLKNFNISHNRLKKIESFEHIQNLEELYLNSNQLEQISDTINQLSNLTRLNLQINRLKEIPSLVLSSLTKLILSRNQLRSFEYHKLKDLEDLDLSDNSLTEMGYNYLPKMLKLVISNNMIEHLELFEYPKIKQVVASNNKLVEFPLFHNRNRPKKLHLDYNLIENFPTSCQFLNSVHLLNLAHNQLKTIPFKIQRMISLENRALQLSSNPIKQVESWNFIAQKATMATLKFLEGKKDLSIRENPKITKEATMGEIEAKDSSLEDD